MRLAPLARPRQTESHAARPAAARPTRGGGGLPLYLQRAALAVGAPDSPLEREAEEVAQQAVVMRKPESGGACCAGCAGGGACDEEDAPVAAAGLVQRAPVAAPAASPRLSELASPSGGAPLAGAVRERVEPVLGADLGHVRVHADADAQAKAGALRARAFTHGSHIWLGRGQSPGDLGLMAHEAAHVVQQGAAATPDTPLVQRRPADYRVAEDGAAVRGRLEARIAEEVEDPPEEEVTPAEARRRMGEVDRGELAGKKAAVAPEARPDVDRPAAARPVVEGAAATTERRVEQPPEPLVAGAEEEAAGKEGEGEKKKEPEAPGEAAAAGALASAEMAFALAESVPMPMPEPDVVPPEPVAEPTDAAGAPLPGDPAADEAVAGLAGRAQALREGGLVLGTQAAQVRGNADVLRGNIALVRGGVGQAEASLAVSEDQLSYRREVVGLARQSLAISEEKAAKVAAEAPGFGEKAGEGREESGPMASEAEGMAAESAANTPDDEEAAADAREQGGKVEEVRQGSATMDGAIRQTGEKATSLAADAERARAVNEKTKTRITGTDAALTATGERLGTMREQAAAARESVEALAAEPDGLTAGADALAAQGAAMVAASFEFEARLRGLQGGYAAAMRAVPPQRPAEQASGGGGPAAEAAPGGGEVVVQRQAEGDAAEAEVAPEAAPMPEPAAAPEPTAAPGGAPATDRYEAREQIDLASGLPAWLTGVDPETEAQRQKRKKDADDRRIEEIALIDDWAGGKFAELNGFEKVGYALALNGRRLWRKIAGIGWPDWRKAGKFLVGLLDPRTALSGVVGGLSMTVSGLVNLPGVFSLEAWTRRPMETLQNLLKSAADIATGITIVLGSITALAGAIAAIMTAITILSFGFAAPVTGPIIAFCTSVMVTVGGWTIAVGKIALILQALVLIKNLIDAACAESADQLQAQADQIGTDAGNMLNIGLQIGGAKMAQLGGRAAQRSILEAGGGVRAAAGLGAGARVVAGRGAAGLRGVVGRIRERGLRGAFRDWRAARAAPRPPKPPGPGWRARWRDWRKTMREQTAPLEKGQAGVSLDYLLGKGVRSFREAAEAASLRRLDVRIAGLVRSGTPEALGKAAGLMRERGSIEARRLLRRLEGIDPTVPPAPAPGAAGVAYTKPQTVARGHLSAEEVYAAYNDALARAGGREVGIFQKVETGEFAVRVGEFGRVGPPWDGEWTGLLHFHPNPRNVLTFRLPAPQDFNGPIRRFWAGGGRTAVREVVEFDIPGVGRGRTEFGIEPGPEPFYVKIRQPDGRTATLRFTDDEAYRAYWGSRKIYVEPGTGEFADFIKGIDDWLREQRGQMPAPRPPGERTMAGTRGPDVGAGRPPPVATGPDLHQRQRAAALRRQAAALEGEATKLDTKAAHQGPYKPARAAGFRTEADKLRAQARALRDEADEFASGRRSATADIVPTEREIEAKFPTKEEIEAGGKAREIKAEGASSVPISKHAADFQVKARDLRQRANDLLREAEGLEAQAARLDVGHPDAQARAASAQELRTKAAELQDEATQAEAAAEQALDRHLAAEADPARTPRIARPIRRGPGGGRLVYRIEGGGSREVITITPDGRVTFKEVDNLHLNFGSLERAEEFLAKETRGPGAKIIAFEVDESWVQAARSAAIPEHETARVGGLQLVDVTYAADQMKIPGALLPELEEFVVPGSAHVVRERR